MNFTFTLLWKRSVNAVFYMFQWPWSVCMVLALFLFRFFFLKMPAI